MLTAQTVARTVVFTAFCLALLVSLGAWLVRTRRVSPFSALARGLRAVTEPVLQPIERRIVRSGGNPAQAGWWLVIGVAVLGLVLLSLLEWLVGAVHLLAAALAGGPRSTLSLAVIVVYQVLFIVLIVRVVSTWFGAFRYSRWMRPAYLLTDWLVEPIRRVLPPFGMFDFSPLAAMLVLYLLRGFLLSII
jgi:YggT family protein